MNDTPARMVSSYLVVTGPRANDTPAGMVSSDLGMTGHRMMS